MPLEFSATPIEGLTVYKTSVIGDVRGSFARLFCIGELATVLGERRIVQINKSVTSNVGAIRGMHLQNAPNAEMKIVRCLRGRVFDVAIDLRAHSPQFCQWYSVELSAEEQNAVIIPEGFAHGFQVLEPDSELLYLHTAFYAPASEWGIRYDDPRINVSWPLPVTDVSARDQRHPWLEPNFAGAQI
ncbi:dTDP-4-dehydrorhamnose 3,5-epimerase family protein [Mesorhizobium sp. B1-1-8]|nr:dTDP-4-dehydrorhamnose 3,5-epimerase family protein [Mesorhizobium sp. B1-1-8]